MRRLVDGQIGSERSHSQHQLIKISNLATLLPILQHVNTQLEFTYMAIVSVCRFSLLTISFFQASCVSMMT
jgi:hypothetical protein